MTSYSRIRAVVFDAVGTVMYPDPSVAEAYRKALHRHCHVDTDIETVAAVLREALQNRSTDADLRTSEHAEHQFWADLIRRLCPNSDGFDACFKDLFDHFAQPHHWRCFSDVAETLQELENRQFIVGIASNFDLRLNSVCDGLRELAHVDQRIISSMAGWRKPAPEFFRAICSSLKMPASDILMVGDDMTNDVRGALSFGMPAVLIDRSQTASNLPDGANIITSLEQLLPLLDGDPAQNELVR